MENSNGIWGWDIVKLVVIGTIIFLGRLLLFDGFEEPGIREAIRWTARLSVVFFCIAFAASGIQRLFPGLFSFYLMMNRKYFGISFAIIHLIHLFFLVILQYNFHPVFEKAKTISLIGGGMAYFFLVMMLLTSFDFFSKFLSKRQWKLLHTIGGYWIFYIFLRSYVKRALTENEYIPFVILLVFVLIVRLWPKKKKTEKAIQ